MSENETLSSYMNSEGRDFLVSGTKRFLLSKAAWAVAAIGIASTLYDADRTLNAFHDLEVKDSAVRTFYLGSESIILGGYAWSMQEARKTDTAFPLIPMSASQEIPLDINFAPHAA